MLTLNLSLSNATMKRRAYRSYSARALAYDIAFASSTAIIIFENTTFIYSKIFRGIDE